MINCINFIVFNEDVYEIIIVSIAVLTLKTIIAFNCYIDIVLANPLQKVLQVLGRRFNSTFQIIPLSLFVNQLKKRSEILRYPLTYTDRIWLSNTSGGGIHFFWLRFHINNYHIKGCSNNYK
jgi:hypothetical protein